ncbi:hypothetical protein ACIRD2_34210 [Streptomyces sp. NPDC093595]|uniref:hypothetical protein n=1 Tax=Streptomyces sp. NPDC093595 TaxID=3366045 RepID=UPI00382D44BA
MVLKDGTVRTVRLSPRDPDECFFCDAPPTCLYTGRAVVMNLKDTVYGRALSNPDVSAEIFSAGDWPVCDPCRAFIDAEQWGRLARHVGLRRLPAEWGLIRTALTLPARALR